MAFMRTQNKQYGGGVLCGPIAEGKHTMGMWMSAFQKFLRRNMAPEALVCAAALWSQPSTKQSLEQFQKRGDPSVLNSFFRYRLLYCLQEDMPTDLGLMRDVFRADLRNQETVKVLVLRACAAYKTHIVPNLNRITINLLMETKPLPGHAEVELDGVSEDVPLERMLSYQKVRHFDEKMTGFTPWGLDVEQLRIWMFMKKSYMIPFGVWLQPLIRAQLDQLPKPEVQREVSVIEDVEGWSLENYLFIYDKHVSGGPAEQKTYAFFFKMLEESTPLLWARDYLHDEALRFYTEYEDCTFKSGVLLKRKRDGDEQPKSKKAKITKPKTAKPTPPSPSSSSDKEPTPRAPRVYDISQDFPGAHILQVPCGSKPGVFAVRDLVVKGPIRGDTHFVWDMAFSCIKEHLGLTSLFVGITRAAEDRAYLSYRRVGSVDPEAVEERVRGDIVVGGIVPEKKMGVVTLQTWLEDPMHEIEDLLTADEGLIRALAYRHMCGISDTNPKNILINLNEEKLRAYSVDENGYSPFPGLYNKHFNSDKAVIQWGKQNRSFVDGVVQKIKNDMETTVGKRVRLRVERMVNGYRPKAKWDDDHLMLRLDEFLALFD